MARSGNHPFLSLCLLFSSPNTVLSFIMGLSISTAYEPQPQWILGITTKEGHVCTHLHTHVPAMHTHTCIHTHAPT
jgi:hypothetical protein